MSDTLPKHWKMVPLGDFCSLSYGKGLSTKEMSKEGYSVYGANGVIGFYQDFMFSDSKLIIASRGTIGQLHRTVPNSYVTSNSIIIESLIPEITDDFLEIAIKSVDKSIIITGSAQPQITIQNLRTLKVPIPSIAEQTIIVKKVGTALSTINNYLPKLEAIPKTVFKLKRKIINDAARGYLTNTNQGLKDNTELIDLLTDYFNQRIEANSKVKLSTDAFDFVENTEITVPKNWVWSRLINVAEVIGGVTKGRKLDGRETIQLPYLRVANVQDGFLDLNEIKYIEVLSSDLDKYKLLYGDILFTEGGDRDKLGRGTVWKNEINDCIHQNHIFRARVFSQYINPEYISIYTKSDDAKDYFFSNASQTVNLASINLTSLSNIPIPIPPIAEQNSIVSIVNTAIQNLDNIIAKYSKALELIKRTESLIYKKAFSGFFSSHISTHNDALVYIDKVNVSSRINKARSKLNQNSNILNKLNEHHKKDSTKDIDHENKLKNPKKINKFMKAKPIEKSSELIARLENLGGVANPEELLIACRLENEIDIFYDLLREARNKKLIEVPIGENGAIKLLK
ncbi:Restriction endonuclease S subunit [Chryseobacterium taeanense]|uniref:Restriction endonuclease S subunit n=1 Tax=Chryseobacterium taeanense TaxID=311334 RepID=A0A1G8LVC9_9FLAO|nr:restriction endonuclease subunit S [Chryseobacterium taeanense]SDI59639.1 Restriction endonuclease S subunit [Chryseobacterium taeanense]